MNARRNTEAWKDRLAASQQKEAKNDENYPKYLIPPPKHSLRYAAGLVVQKPDDDFHVVFPTGPTPNDWDVDRIVKERVLSDGSKVFNIFQTLIQSNF